MITYDDGQYISLAMAEAIVNLADEKNIMLRSSNKNIVKQKIDLDLNRGVINFGKLCEWDEEYLAELAQDELDKITNINFSNSKIRSPKGNSDILIISNWFKNGKLANLKTIDMHNGKFADEFVFVLIDAMTANKLPRLEKIELDGATMSPKLRDLLDNAIERFGAKCVSSVSHY